MVQVAPSPETAIDAWVLAGAAGSPARARAQAAALEFHCGNPPPAAEPRDDDLHVSDGIARRGAQSHQATSFRRRRSC